MAFTDAQKISICQILEITPLTLDAQITWLGANLTAAIETAVIAQITAWATAGANFTNIHPNERNFGAEINASSQKSQIRTNIAVLFEMPDWANGVGSMNSYFVRG